MRRLALLLCTTLVTFNVLAEKRALLIGINDYSASRFPKPKIAQPSRDWPNLRGTVNDVTTIAEMLVLRYGFERRNIVTLTDQQATRAAILQSLERHLIQTAAKDDVHFFYFAGHGSQVKNSLSDEPDGFDESVVPADSRAGAPDIRDKELRLHFNRILDRGARLTILLDHCHSGSGARGLLTGATARGIKPDLRDVADKAKEGPRPESRGALVIASAQDFDAAWETQDDQKQMRGVFSWAWIRAMRDAAPGEPAAETFLRAQARVRGETPFQEPVLEGTPEVRQRPFLATRGERRGEVAAVAVTKIRADGTAALNAGWASGLSVGSELRERRTGARLTITAIEGLAHSEARVTQGRVAAGALLDVVRYGVSQGRPLRVWIPPSTAGLTVLARQLESEAKKRGLRWIADPTTVAPTSVLRRGTAGWELVTREGTVRRVDDVIAGMRSLPRNSSLFVQFPATSAIATNGVERVSRAEDADYLLTGRFAKGHIEYAWVRPHSASLPARTAWAAEAQLPNRLERLRKIHSWHQLHSPARSPYRLGVRRARDGQAVRGRVTGGERYQLVLRTDAQPPSVPRYFYVFVIDTHGNAFLVFPQSGSVENRFPIGPPRAEIPLGEASTFLVQPPYGRDTYFLLTTDEPLPNPWVLTWDGVRAGLLRSSWTVERAVIESVAP